jgi:hypothetical protein
MGMTGPGETHKVEVELDGGQTGREEGETKAIMNAIRDLLRKYNGCRIGRQEVIIVKKTRPPDSKP